MPKASHGRLGEVLELRPTSLSSPEKVPVFWEFGYLFIFFGGCEISQKYTPKHFCVIQTLGYQNFKLIKFKK